MRIHIATDHAGLEFSKDLQKHLADAGHEVVDHGPKSFDPVDDYPSFCINAARAVVRDQSAGIETLGIVFGGSGNGEQMAANKVLGARAALVWSVPTAELARQHNDANLISIGARQHTVEEAILYIDTFIATPFSGEERHVRRIAQLAEYEKTGAIAGHEID
ncbi:MAG: ribose-5-phosphate isomerase [Glaciihabitans sp.]|jgi:ribose 5-phosphate isomerase B|nr:ribose-5-phosphate isomerase [Glaciihabitans sp.]